MDWLREFEPQCAEVMEAHAGELEDFLALQHFAHSCERVFSPGRWALVGEAGVFTDPFYSPGSDFIAMGNDYVTDLIVRDHAGEDIAARVESFNTMYLRLFDAFIRLYDGQYRIMGNAQVMTAKVAWDNACYWAIPALLFFQRRYRRPEFIASIDTLMLQVLRPARPHAGLFQGMGPRRRRKLLRARGAERRRGGVPSQAAGEPRRSPHGRRRRCAARLEENFALLETFARTWQAVASEQYPALARFVSAAAAADRSASSTSAALRVIARPPSSVD